MTNSVLSEASATAQAILVLARQLWYVRVDMQTTALRYGALDVSLPRSPALLRRLRHGAPMP